MKYLNDEIEVFVAFTNVVPKDGTYTYSLKWNGGVGTRNQTFFYGNVFLEKGRRSKNFYLGDILRNYYWVNDRIKIYGGINVGSYTDSDILLIDKVNLTVEVNGYTNSKDSDWICFAYKYPNYKNYLGKGSPGNWSDIPFDPSVTSSWAVNMLQSQVAKGGILTPSLMPTFPFIKTSSYGYGMVMEISKEGITDTKKYKTVTFSGKGSLSFENNPIFDCYWPVSDFMEELEIFLEGASIDANSNEDALLYCSTGDYVAKFDKCPAKYYLMWQDRMGGIQSQPFKAIDTFSIDYDITEKEDYKGFSSPSSIIASSKWFIQTGWIKDQEVPLYESIFISPYLLLYDTENDTSYNVKVTDRNFIEKTFVNQGRKMFNLQLNLEQSVKQNIIL